MPLFAGDDRNRLEHLRRYLSLNAYLTDCGGFVYVKAPKYRVPPEPDLAMSFEMAESARVAWLMVDREAAVIDGLLVFDTAKPGP